MPELNRCTLVVTLKDAPLTHYSPHSDFLFRGNAFNFVVQVADQEAYDWVSVRGQAIKDTLLAQEQAFASLNAASDVTISGALAYSAARLGMQHPSAWSAFTKRSFDDIPVSYLMAKNLLSVPSEDINIDLNYAKADGSSGRETIVINNNP